MDERQLGGVALDEDRREGGTEPTSPVAHGTTR
jgi:hypothetical protein